MDFQKVNRILILLFLTLISSCTSTNQLLQSEQIFIGMSSSLFCQRVFMTSLDEDPCIGKREYYPSKKVMVLTGENENRFFVFENVPNKNTNLNISSVSRLILITSTMDEVEFYLTNFID
mgnify:CR=1 FL=1